MSTMTLEVGGGATNVTFFDLVLASRMTRTKSGTILVMSFVLMPSFVPPCSIRWLHGGRLLTSSNIVWTVPPLVGFTQSFDALLLMIALERDRFESPRITSTSSTFGSSAISGGGLDVFLVTDLYLFDCRFRYCRI